MLLSISPVPISHPGTETGHYFRRFFPIKRRDIVAALRPQRPRHFA